MKTVALLALSVLALSCKKDERIEISPDDAAPPPDATDSRFTGSHALLAPGAEIFSDQSLGQPAFRTRTDHPTLFRLVRADKKVAEIATLDRHDGGGCFEPALGTVGLDIKLFVPRDALVMVTTEKATDEVAPGITATVHPGAWAAGGLIRSQHLAMKKTPATSFSFAPEPIPDDLRLVSVPGQTLPEKLHPLARRRVGLAMGSNRRGERHFDFEHGKRNGGELVVRSGCIELRFKAAPKRSASALLATLGVSRTKAIAAGGKVYYADGSEAGVVAEQLDVLPMSEPPLKGKLCAELAGRTLPHGSALEDVLSGDGVDLSAALADGERKPAEPAPAPAPKDSRWVLCFDPP